MNRQIEFFLDSCKVYFKSKAAMTGNILNTLQNLSNTFFLNNIKVRLSLKKIYSKHLYYSKRWKTIAKMFSSQLQLQILTFTLFFNTVSYFKLKIKIVAKGLFSFWKKICFFLFFLFKRQLNKLGSFKDYLECLPCIMLWRSRIHNCASKRHVE